jgi:hypothetical protein
VSSLFPKFSTDRLPVLCAAKPATEPVSSPLGAKNSSANARHSYQFPRIYAIMNDGTKSYDVGKDGADQEIGACSVRFFPSSPSLFGQTVGPLVKVAHDTLTAKTHLQINFRRTDVTAKARLTYFAGKFLEVGTTEIRAACYKEIPLMLTHNRPCTARHPAQEMGRVDDLLCRRGRPASASAVPRFLCLDRRCQRSVGVLLPVLITLLHANLTKTKQMHTTSSRSRPRTVRTVFSFSARVFAR